MNLDESDEELSGYSTPPDFRESAEKVKLDLLLEKSRTVYENAYEKFNKWRTKHNTVSASESVMLTYFEELSKTYKSTSLWSNYSMIKCMLNLKENVDISKYHQVTTFLKKKAVGFKKKKSSVFLPEHIDTFLNQAPDLEYLAAKVILIFGISGACRKGELVNIKVTDIENQGDLIVVNIQKSKVQKPRVFAICDKFTGFIRKYQNLRPKSTTTDRFFLNYRKGKCTVQVIGINKFGKTPQLIASYLNLPNPNNYTGHSFRRTASTLTLGSLTSLKICGDWNSQTVAKENVEKSEDKEPCNIQLAEKSCEEDVYNAAVNDPILNSGTFILDFEDLTKKIWSDLKCNIFDWEIKVLEDKVIFYNFNQDEPLRVLNQIVVDKNLNMRVFKENIEISVANFSYSSQSVLMNLSQLEDLLIKYRNTNSKTEPDHVLLTKALNILNVVKNRRSSARHHDLENIEFMLKDFVYAEDNFKSSHNDILIEETKIKTEIIDENDLLLT